MLVVGDVCFEIIVFIVDSDIVYMFGQICDWLDIVWLWFDFIVCV